MSIISHRLGSGGGGRGAVDRDRSRLEEVGMGQKGYAKNM